MKLSRTVCVAENTWGLAWVSIIVIHDIPIEVAKRVLLGYLYGYCLNMDCQGQGLWFLCTDFVI